MSPKRSLIRSKGDRGGLPFQQETDCWWWHIKKTRREGESALDRRRRVPWTPCLIPPCVAVHRLLLVVVDGLFFLHNN